MTTIQIGRFPGKLENYILDENTTINDALNAADIRIGDEQEVKLDGEVVNLNDAIGDGKLLVVTKRIKGN